MLRQGSAAASRQLRGVLTDFRIAVPESDGVGSFKIEQTWVRVGLDLYPHGRPVDASINNNASDVSKSSQIVEAIAGARSNVVVGIRDSKRGLPGLEWLLSPHGNLIPRTRRDLRKKGGKILLRWSPWLLLSSAVFAWSAFNMMRGFADVMLFVFACVPLLICGVCTYLGLGLLVFALRSRRYRATERALQALLEKAPAERFAGMPESGLGTSSSLHSVSDASKDINRGLRDNDTQALPHLTRLAGKVSEVDMQRTQAGGSVQWMSGSNMVSINNRIDFRCYGFKLQGESYALFASRNFGGGRLFLAENDRVEVIVAAYDQLKSGLPKLVWAMRNVEDGQVYACHRVMAPVASSLVRPLIGSFRMTQLTPAFRRSMRIWMTVIWIGVMLFAGAIIVAGDDPAYTFFVIAAFGLPVMWLTCFELPMRLWNLKWRKGHPSQRQQLTERVYALLDAGSPWNATSTLIDV